MNNNMSVFDEQEIKSYIHSLLAEKERYKQEKLTLSCEIALGALDDPDENVVEAVLEVIAEHHYTEAEDKLREILNKTNSIWIINALIRAFADLDIKNISGVIVKKILSLEATTLEKSILMNTYVRALGSIGSYHDIELILNKYSKDIVINDSNLVFGLSSLILKSETSKLPVEITRELKRFFQEHWDYQNSSQVFVSIAAFVKLQQDFFHHDIKEIYSFYKENEFFIERLFELVQGLDKIPDSFVHEILTAEETVLVMMGLNLIYRFNSLDVMDLLKEASCSEDTFTRMAAIKALNFMNDGEAINILQRMLEDQIEEIREAATAALCKKEVEE